jgi:hypothetical protein
MLKRISVKILGSGNPKTEEVVMAEGTTPATLKSSLKAPTDYQVYRKSTKQYLKDDADLNSILNDGEDLELTPKSKLGALSWELFFSIFTVWKLIRPENGNNDIAPVKEYNLEEELREFGFSRYEENDFIGWLITDRSAYYCLLQWYGRGEYELFIRDPPINALQGFHGPCFFHISDNCYVVHFNSETPPVVKLRKLQRYLKKVGG